jgi:hypothetical protein
MPAAKSAFDRPITAAIWGYWPIALTRVVPLGCRGTNLKIKTMKPQAYASAITTSASSKMMGIREIDYALDPMSLKIIQAATCLLTHRCRGLR